MKNKILILVLFVLTASYSTCVLSQEKADKKPEIITDEYLISLWRIEKITSEDIDKHYCKTYPNKEKCEKGYKLSETSEWKEFISKYQENDELWFYMSPPETWETLMGSQGYAIFRNGKVIAYFTTLLN